MVLLTQSRMQLDSNSIPAYFMLARLIPMESGKEDAKSYQTAAEEQYGNRNVLEICSRPWLTCTGEVLQENICRAI
jgi:hypothetical protein